MYVRRLVSFVFVLRREDEELNGREVKGYDVDEFLREEFGLSLRSVFLFLGRV